jgi:hypothetical protein
MAMRPRPAFGVAKLAAENARERRGDGAEQQRHECPEREEGARGGGFVGRRLIPRASIAGAPW